MDLNRIVDPGIGWSPFANEEDKLILHFLFSFL